VYAQSTPKPTMPEFTLKVVNSSINHPAIYSIDPYTGKNETVTPATHDETKDIVITITNQPFTPFKDSNGNWILLFYNIQSKGHFSDSWSTISYKYDLGWLTQSNSDFTLTSYDINSTAVDAQFDFRVQAMIGYFNDSGFPEYMHIEPTFVGQTSDWSSTQTVTKGASSNSPNPVATVPELSWLAIVPLLLSVLPVALLLKHRKVTHG
jgi:hypothetical protein